MFSIDRIVYTNSLGTVNHLYRNGKNTPKGRVPGLQVFLKLETHVCSGNTFRHSVMPVSWRGSRA